jgi:hypothetical protein
MEYFSNIHHLLCICQTLVEYTDNPYREYKNLYNDKHIYYIIILYNITYTNATTQQRQY